MEGAERQKGGGEWREGKDGRRWERKECRRIWDK